MVCGRKTDQCFRQKSPSDPCSWAYMGFWEQGRKAAVCLETADTEQAVHVQATDTVRKEF